MASKKSIHICDTTLRDGEQMPGVSFAPEQKLELAGKICEFGADSLELMPAVSSDEQQVAALLGEASLLEKVTASTMLREEHIDLAADLGIGSVTLFSSVSDIHLQHKLRISREENILRSLAAVEYALSRGLSVRFAVEDASRADMDYLKDFCAQLSPYLEYFMPCDTLGCLTPLQSFCMFWELSGACKCRLGSHCHNDLGLATANTLASIEGGASMFSGTFCGIGERAGNAAIEEVCVALHLLKGGMGQARLEKTSELCSLVSRYSRVALHPHKPIVGANAFSHESGIHVDGVLKDPRTYEYFEPGLVGAKRILYFGKKSGRRAAEYLTRKYPKCGQQADSVLAYLKNGKHSATGGMSEEDFSRAFSPGGANSVSGRSSSE